MTFFRQEPRLMRKLRSEIRKSPAEVLSCSADSRKSAGSFALTPWSWQSSPSSVAELRTSPEASKPAPQSIFMAQKESLNVDNFDSGHCQEGGLRWPDVLCAPKR